MAVVNPAAARPLAARLWRPAVLAAFACWLVLAGSRHEPWIDESQAWLLARDCSLWQLLAERVRYEGSPGLWHILLWLCIRGGLPFGMLHLVSALCALCGAALLLWRSPFPPWLRIILIASYFMAYQYAVVARSYALDLALLPLLADRFAERARAPLGYGLLLGLLANCNAHSLVAAAVLGCEFLLACLRAGTLRTRPAVAGLAIAALAGLVAVACAWPPKHNGFINSYHPSLLRGAGFILEAFVDRPLPWSATEPSPLSIELGLDLSVLLLIPCFAAFRQAGTLPLATALFLGLIAFSVLVYANAWHTGILFLAWLFCLWISWPALDARPRLKRLAAAAVAAIGMIQATEAAASGSWDLRQPYDAGPAAASAIAAWKRGHPQGRVAYAGFKSFSVQPYFSANVFDNYHGGAPSAYIQWEQTDGLQPAAALRFAYAALQSDDALIVLSPFGSSAAELAQFTAQAAGRGYRLMAGYPGGLEWKGYVREDATLLLFARGSGAAPP